jgi:FkbM family methyltransferase
MRRKDFLIGSGGFALGALLGVYGERGAATLDTTPAAPALPALPEAAPARGEMSYAQAGEDMIVRNIFENLNVHDITYLDIGANDPILLSNTYYFYRRGYRGVLVEPNAALCEKLRAVRPKDTTLEAGIGTGKATMADFYLLSEPAWSTFDKAEAEERVRDSGGKVTIKEVRRMPLLDVNAVMAEHFAGAAPDFLSVDAEGWDLRILRSIDYRRLRPKVICAETLAFGSLRAMPEIPAFMRTKGYSVRGGSFVNTIFVDSTLLA